MKLTKDFLALVHCLLLAVACDYIILSYAIEGWLFACLSLSHFLLSSLLTLHECHVSTISKLFEMSPVAAVNVN